MGSNTLNFVTDPAVADSDDVNQYFTAITGDFLPRNASSGATEDEQHSLGVPSAQWLNTYTKNLFIDGQLLDISSLAAGGDSKNAIVSGATRSGSEQPDFIRASGSSNALTILAATTNLQITANSTSVTISSDIPVTGLTLAPSSNNTCLINDTSLSDQSYTKYVGEHPEDKLTIDTAGTEITSRVGQYVALKGASEYMLAYVEDDTTLSNIFRGFFFDSSGSPIVRETLANNDTLTLMALGWVFLDSNGVTVDVTYTTPIYSSVEPSSPATDDYWYDTINTEWKRYDGSSFQTVDRIPVGLVVIDTANAVASRSLDFTKSFSDFIDFEVETRDVNGTVGVYTKNTKPALSVYGKTISFPASPIQFDATDDIETGSPANNTLYYLYITQDGVKKSSLERPVNRESDLKGWYHPYHTWRFVGVAETDGSAVFDAANSHNSKEKRTDFFTSSSTFYPVPNKKNKVTVIGGGGGGASSSSSGSGGGTTSFGSFCSGSGGSGGGTGDASSSGGSGSGGDLNISGCASSSGAEPVCGSGGPSMFGGGGRGGQTSGSSGSSGSSGGGGGGANNGLGTPANGGGGGGGGAAIKELYILEQTVTLTIGSGGSGGSSNGRTGGSGGAGLCMVEYI